MREGVTATDLVLTVTQMLRKKGVVGKFVEFYGPGLDEMALEDRATIANMAPEYGATCGFFPIDAETVRYLKATARKPAPRRAGREICEGARPVPHRQKRRSGLHRHARAGSRRRSSPASQDRAAAGSRVARRCLAGNFATALIDTFKKEDDANRACRLEGTEYTIGHGDVVIAAITSCTNTSNPSVMIGAGLVAQKAIARGLKVRPWVKTSLAPGSQVVTDYLAKAGLDKALDKLGFRLVGYGCTTCIGNSGPLPEPVAKAVTEGDLVAAAVISGNRNFEGRVHPQVRANYLASPMLVVAYALAGSINIDLTQEPVGYDKENEPVYLQGHLAVAQGNRRGHPQGGEARELQASAMAMCSTATPTGRRSSWSRARPIAWDIGSTYVKNPPYFDGMSDQARRRWPRSRARASWRCSAIPSPPTTSRPPAHQEATAPAGEYLIEHQVSQKDFNSYGSRRGNHEVMERGTFANIRIRNEMMGGKEGGNTIYYPRRSRRARKCRSSTRRCATRKTACPLW